MSAVGTKRKSCRRSAISAFEGKAHIPKCPVTTQSAHRISPDWSQAGSSCYFLIVTVIVVRHETAAAARWALLLIIGALFNDAITIAIWTGFHCVPPGSTPNTRNR
jgi:hypothetical protein